MPERPEKLYESRQTTRHKQWRRDFRLESWRDRFITLCCAMGIIIPLGRAWKEGAVPTTWTGDRWAVIILFAIVGILSVTLTSED